MNMILQFLSGFLFGSSVVFLLLKPKKNREEYECGVGIFECHKLLFDLVSKDGTKKRCRNWMNYTDETREFLSVYIYYEDGEFSTLHQIGTYDDIKYIIHDGDKFVPYKYMGEDCLWNTTFKRT